MSEKTEIELKDKEGKPIKIKVEIPPTPQPQILVETFNYHELDKELKDINENKKK